MKNFRLSAAFFCCLWFVVLDVKSEDPKTVHEEQIGDWGYIVTEDEFTDEKSYIAGGAFTPNRSESKGHVFVACNIPFPREELSGLVVILSTGEQLGSYETPQVKYRVDKNKYKVVEFNESHGDSVGLEVNEKSTVVQDLMEGKSKFLFELTDSEGSSSRARFSLRGAAQAIQKVLDNCEVERTPAKAPPPTKEKGAASRKL